MRKPKIYRNAAIRMKKALAKEGIDTSGIKGDIYSRLRSVGYSKDDIDAFIMNSASGNTAEEYINMMLSVMKNDTMKRDLEAIAKAADSINENVEEKPLIETPEINGIQEEKPVDELPIFYPDDIPNMQRLPEDNPEIEK